MSQILWSVYVNSVQFWLVISRVMLIGSVWIICKFDVISFSTHSRVLPCNKAIFPKIKWLKYLSNLPRHPDNGTHRGITISTHDGSFSDIRHCQIFQSDIRHWGWKLFDIRHSKISPTLDTLPLKGEKMWIWGLDGANKPQSYKVDTRHCQKFDLNTRHSDPPSWVLPSASHILGYVTVKAFISFWIKM